MNIEWAKHDLHALSMELLAPGILYSPCPDCGRLVECGAQAVGHYTKWCEGAHPTNAYALGQMDWPLFACPCGAHWAGK